MQAADRIALTLGGVILSGIWSFLRWWITVPRALCAVLLTWSFGNA